VKTWLRARITAIPVGLRGRSFPVAVALAGMALAAPALTVGFVLDDFLLMRNDSFGRVPADVPGKLSERVMQMFLWADGDPQTNHPLMGAGIFPWWTFDGLRIAFWRPASALTHWIDFALWPRRAPVMHAHSLLWFGALLVSAGIAYRGFFGQGWIGGLAVLGFGVSYTHGQAIGWISSRHALLSALFGILAIWAHQRWCPQRRGILLGPLFLLLALLSGEAAIAAAAFVVAYALCLHRAPWLARLRSVAPYAAVVLAWSAFYVLSGYGTRGTSFYIDPVTSPRDFARSLPWHAAALLRMLFINVEIPWVAGVVVSPLVVVLVPLLRDREVRFWTVGTLLALLPACATLPQPRLLFFAGFGAMGLLARVIAIVAAPESRSRYGPRGRGVVATVAGALLLTRVLAGLALLPHEAAAPKRTLQEWVDGVLPRPAPSVSGPEADEMVIVNAPVPFAFFYLPAVRHARGQPVPPRVLVLAADGPGLSLSRPDERSVVVRRDGGLSAGTLGFFFRSSKHPMRMGETVRLGRVQVEVNGTTAEGAPSAATFRFGIPLDAGPLRWLEWRGGRYVPFVMPVPGETVAIGT